MKKGHALCNEEEKEEEEENEQTMANSARLTELLKIAQQTWVFPGENENATFAEEDSGENLSPRIDYNASESNDNTNLSCRNLNIFHRSLDNSTNDISEQLWTEEHGIFFGENQDDSQAAAKFFNSTLSSFKPTFNHAFPYNIGDSINQYKEDSCDSSLCTIFYRESNGLPMMYMPNSIAPNTPLSSVLLFSEQETFIHQTPECFIDNSDEKQYIDRYSIGTTYRRTSWRYSRRFTVFFATEASCTFPICMRVAG